MTVRLRPYGKLVATRFDEVKAPAAGKGKDRFDDFPTGSLDLGQGGFQLCAVEHDQRAAVIAARGHLGAEETTIQAFVGEGGVIGAVVRESPAESGLEEGLGCRQIAGGVFDVVDLLVGRHAGFLGGKREGVTDVIWPGRWRPG